MNEWISVEEHLPETEENVLVWHNFTTYINNSRMEYYDIARYYPKFHTWIGDNVDEDSIISYWMPLPQAPKPNSEDMINNV